MAWPATVLAVAGQEIEHFLELGLGPLLVRQARQPVLARATAHRAVHADNHVRKTGKRRSHIRTEAEHEPGRLDRQVELDVAAKPLIVSLTG